MSKHIEFPTDGKFDGVEFGRYKVLGDDVNSSVGERPRSLDDPRPFTARSWGISRPWSSGPGGPSSLNANIITNNRSTCKKAAPYEAFWKRSIPFVSLCLDDNGRNVLVDSTINNIYIKISEKLLSVNAIISALATKIGCPPVDLLILDVKFLEIKVSVVCIAMQTD